MFNIGFGELAIICIVLIIAVGPERLPSMMKTVGKTVRTLRQASRDLRESTGIDELLREDFDYHPPPRRPAAPIGTQVSREEPAQLEPPPPGTAVDAGEHSLPSDGPVTAQPTAAGTAAEVAAAAGTTAAGTTAAGTTAAGTTAAGTTAAGTTAEVQVATQVATEPSTPEAVSYASAEAPAAEHAEHADIAGTLPSDAPLAAHEPDLREAGLKPRES
jgi:Tat protein translocase TatB subunit